MTCASRSSCTTFRLLHVSICLEEVGKASLIPKHLCIVLCNMKAKTLTALQTRRP